MDGAIKNVLWKRKKKKKTTTAENATQGYSINKTTTKFLMCILINEHHHPIGSKSILARTNCPSGREREMTCGKKKPRPAVFLRELSEGKKKDVNKSRLV